MKKNPFDQVVSKEIIEKKRACWSAEDYTYYDLFTSMNIDVDFKVEVGGHYGEDGTIYFLGTDKENRAYYLEVFSGCCEHCDHLYGAGDMEDLVVLRDEVKEDIIQFESLHEFETWFNEVRIATKDELIVELVDETDEEDLSDYDEFIKEANKTFNINLQRLNN